MECLELITLVDTVDHRLLLFYVDVEQAYLVKEGGLSDLCTNNFLRDHPQQMPFPSLQIIQQPTHVSLLPQSVESLIGEQVDGVFKAIL